MPETRATYFSVDIECSGPVPAIYDMVSIGIVVVAPGPHGDLCLGETLYLEIKPQGQRIDRDAMRIHGIPFDRLLTDGVVRRDAMLRITEWVRTHTRPKTKPVFVGHNAPFDWSFVAWCFAVEELPNVFGYKALDIKALATGKLGLHWFDSSKEVLHERLGMPPEDLTLKHRADYDAQYQAELLVRLLAEVY